MIQLNGNNHAYKCDLCGGDPSCAKECPFGALLFQEPDKELRKIKGLQMKQRIQSGTPEEKRRQLGLNISKQARQ